MWSHAGPLVLGLVSVPGFIAPLIIMVTKGKQSARVRRNAVEALNFQLTMLILGAVIVIPFILMGTGLALNDFNAAAGGIIVAFLILILLVIVGLAFPIIAIIRSANNDDFRYPVSFRMVK